jgi:hypothetical protein
MTQGKIWRVRAFPCFLCQTFVIYQSTSSIACVTRIGPESMGRGDQKYLFYFCEGENTQGRKEKQSAFTSRSESTGVK